MSERIYRVFIFAGLLDVQNILSVDTVVSPGKLKIIHCSVRQSVLRYRV
jgi:hypothetical protein